MDTAEPTINTSELSRLETSRRLSANEGALSSPVPSKNTDTIHKSLSGSSFGPDSFSHRALSWIEGNADYLLQASSGGAKCGYDQIVEHPWETAAAVSLGAIAIAAAPVSAALGASALIVTGIDAAVTTGSIALGAYGTVTGVSELACASTHDGRNNAYSILTNPDGHSPTEIRGAEESVRENLGSGIFRTAMGAIGIAGTLGSGIRLAGSFEKVVSSPVAKLPVDAPPLLMPPNSTQPPILPAADPSTGLISQVGKIASNNSEALHQVAATTAHNPNSDGSVVPAETTNNALPEHLTATPTRLSESEIVTLGSMAQQSFSDFSSTWKPPFSYGERFTEDGDLVMPPMRPKGPQGLRSGLDLLDPAIGLRFSGHGIGMRGGSRVNWYQNQLVSLDYLLTRGVNMNHPFYEMPLRGCEEAAAAFRAARPWQDGGFIVLGGLSSSIYDGGIKYVLVNDSFYNAVPLLQARYPEVEFIRADQVSTRLPEIVRESNRKS